MLGSLPFSGVRLQWQCLQCFTLISPSVWISVSPCFLKLSLTPLGRHSHTAPYYLCRDGRLQMQMLQMHRPTHKNTHTFTVCYVCLYYKHIHTQQSAELDVHMDTCSCKCKVLIKTGFGCVCERECVCIIECVLCSINLCVFFIDQWVKLVNRDRKLWQTRPVSMCIMCVFVHMNFIVCVQLVCRSCICVFLCVHVWASWPVVQPCSTSWLPLLDPSVFCVTSKHLIISSSVIGIQTDFFFFYY